MKDYYEFPPLKYFARVLKNCPKSSLVYVQIWINKTKDSNLVVGKKDVRKDYFISPTVFRNLLGPLMLLNLISFTESDGNFQIDIFGSQLNE
jgi:hypothetical protein